MRVAVLIVILFLFLGTAFYVYNHKTILSPVSQKKSEEIQKPLEKYSFPNLIKTNFSASPIVLGRTLQDYDTFTSQVFYYAEDPGINSGKTAKVSGLINVPKDPGNYPVIVMFRGYV